MKQVYKELALQAGGSHYPDVGGQNLQRFGDLLIARVIEVIADTPQNHAYTSYDTSLISSTVNKIIDNIKTQFEVGGDQ